MRVDAARFVLEQQSRFVERYDAFGDLRFEPAFDTHLIARCVLHRCQNVGRRNAQQTGKGQRQARRLLLIDQRRDDIQTLEIDIERQDVSFAVANNAARRRDRQALIHLGARHLCQRASADPHLPGLNAAQMHRHAHNDHHSDQQDQVQPPATDRDRACRCGATPRRSTIDNRAARGAGSHIAFLLRVQRQAINR